MRPRTRGGRRRCAFRVVAVATREICRNAANWRRSGRPMVTGHVLVIDQGTTSTRAIVFDADARAGRHRRSRNSRRSIRSPAGSNTIRRTSGARRWRPRARRWRRAGARRRRSRRSASPTSAKRRWSGTAQTGQADPQRDRLAGSPHRRSAAPNSKRAGPRARWSRERTGLAARSLFLRDQDRLDARQRRRRARARGARRARLRHGRQLFCSGA